MKSHVRIPRLFWFLVLGAVLFAAGCSFDTSGLTPTKHYYECSVEVWSCPPTNKPLTVKLTGPALYPQLSNYKLVPDLWSKSQAFRVYWDTPVVVAGIELDKLKGALQVMTGQSDWKVTGSDLLRIELKNDVEGLYVAYDARANPKPLWLTKDYRQEIDSSTQKPYAIILSTVDPNKPTSPEYIRLEIWRRSVTPTANQVVGLPGNNYGNPGWASVIKGEPAMYSVLITPQSESNCNVLGNKLKSYGYKNCHLDDAEAIAAAEKNCNAAFQPQFQCRNASCPVTPGCYDGTTIYGSVFGLTTFLYSSRVDFISPSQVTVTLMNHQVTVKSGGYMNFKYLTQTHDLQLNSLLLDLGSFDTDLGRFENTTVALLKTPKAACKDTLPVFGQPCDKYEIAQGEFIASENATLKQKPLLWVSSNDQPIAIQINHATKAFQVKGKTQATLKVDGQETVMDLSVDLLGQFTNFSPNPVGTESTRFAECDENSNHTPVLLSAAGSFDIYDTLPSNPANYVWYEDYGLVTQKSWGTGPLVTIPPHQMGFGIHSISLLVTDNNGVVDTATFDVQVGDHQPPRLTIPPDVTAPLQPPGSNGAQVSLGTASATDACSTQVMITNDAPANSFFPPGVTAVTWTADDGRGNLATAVQKVTVQVTQFTLLEAFILVAVVFGAAAGAVLWRRKK